MTERCLRSIRLLAECMQQFEKLSDSIIRQFDLTHPQFDIIATLGNTTGMSCAELGQKTLITKGTLTGVLDRLEDKKLLERVRCNQDRRRSYVRLTALGEDVFKTTFPHLVGTMKERFVSYSCDDFELLEQQLSKLKQILN